MLLRSSSLIVSVAFALGSLPAVAASSAAAAPHAAVASAPAVTSLAPHRARNDHRPLVAVSGTGFTASSTVTFGGEPAAVEYVQSTTLIYARPPSLGGTVDVRVTTDGQQSAVSTNDQYTIVAPPKAPEYKAGFSFGAADLACATDGFCLISGYSGRTVSFSGNARGPVRPTPAYIYDAACTSATFCAAYGAQDRAYVFDGQHWTTSAQLPPLGFDTAISCASRAACLVASLNGTWWRYDGTTWTGGTNGPRPADAQSIDLSCGTATFCAAAMEINDHEEIEESYLYRFNGTSWSKPTVYFDYRDRNATVSCVSATYCFATTRGGDRVWNGSKWTTLTTSPREGMRYVRCFAPNACLAEGHPTPGTRRDHLMRFDGSNWTDLGTVPNAGVRVLSPLVDCSSMTMCRSVTQRDYTRPWRASSGFGPARELWDRLYEAVAVSCAGATYCVAVNAYGRIGLWDGAWHKSVRVDRRGSPTGVSCTAGDQCVLVDDAGYAITITPDGDILAERHIDPHPLSSVSCGSNDFCVATDAAGRVVRFDGGSWHTPTLRGPAGALRAVSCTATPNVCLAVGHGYATHYQGHGDWTPAEHIARYTRAVACTSTTYCVVGLKAGVRLWGGQALSPKYTYPYAGNIYAVSCPVAEYCVVASNSRDYPTESDDTALDGAAHSGFPPRLGVVDDRVACWAPGRCLILGGGDQVEITQ